MRSADEVRDDSLSSCLEKVEDSIEEAAGDGKASTTVFIPEEFVESILDELHENGYSMEHMVHGAQKRGQSKYRIHWT